MKELDRIRLNGLQFYGYHGVRAQERKAGQHISVDVTLKLDLRKAGRTDSLKHTVDYTSVYELVKNVVLNDQCRLIETIAERIANRILENHKSVCEVEVSVRKHNPPVGGIAESVEVSILRKRE